MSTELVNVETTELETEAMFATDPESTGVDWKRVGVFTAWAFGLAWLAYLVIYLNGGLTWPGAVPLLAFGAMLAPGLANILTRLVTREGWRDMGLRPELLRGWPYWLLSWFATAILVCAGVALFFVVMPRFFDPQMTALRAAAPEGTPDLSPSVILMNGLLVAVAISPLVNGIPTFGEEFGWRAYLQPKLMPLGPSKAVLLTSLIWGVWHAPAILMGHNYGLGYPGAPWLGVPMMVIFCLGLGVFEGWLVHKAGSVWPAVIAHAVVNGLAGLGGMFLQGTPNLLIGPAVAGLLGSMGLTVAAVVLLLIPKAWAVRD